MTDSPFAAGQFVWCAYPEGEAPAVPGPLHVGYILAIAADARGFTAMVAYTTSRPWTGAVPAGVHVFSADQAEAMGQHKAFVLDLRRIAYLPIDAEWFPAVAEAGHGSVGRASEKLRQQIEDAATELFTRRPEIVQRLGPPMR